MKSEESDTSAKTVTVETVANKKTDIVIPTYNRPDLVNPLLASIRKHTHIPYRIVLINHGDGDKVASAIPKFKELEYHFEQTTGWVDSVNKGWSYCNADYIITLNDDIVVGEGWTDTLLGALETGVIDICFPVASGGSRGSMRFVKRYVQADYPAYEAFVNFESCAKAVKEKYNGKTHLMREPLSFYAFAMKRETQLKIGELDMQFNHGGCDDDDYCYRVFEKGGNIAIALDTLIFHKVSASGGGYGENFENLIKNKAKLREKWSGLKKKPTVLLAIPNNGRIDVELLAAIERIKATHSEEYKLDFMDYVLTAGLTPVDRARNIISSDFMHSDADFLLMIDDDIIPANDVVAMCLHNKPIVGAICFGYVTNDKMEDGIHPVVFDKEEGTKKYKSAKLNARGLIKCDAIGTGCIMIRRDVLEKMPQPWFEMLFDDKYKLIYGEDIYFCKKAQELGFDIFADRDRVCGHKKIIDLKKIHQQQWNYIVKTREKMLADVDNKINERMAGFMGKMRPGIILPK